MMTFSCCAPKPESCRGAVRPSQVGPKLIRETLRSQILVGWPSFGPGGLNRSLSWLGASWVRVDRSAVPRRVGVYTR